MTRSVGPLPSSSPTPAAPWPPWRLLPVALLLLFVIGDEALLFSLKGRLWALQIVRRDPTGAIFDAAPDDARQAHHANLDFDYAVGVDPARAARAGVPPGTGADGGLEDLRHDIRWVRSRLRSGDTYMAHTWRLEDVLAAAADPERRFYCYSYACAMVSAAEGQGYAARIVYLGRHITSEVYLPARGQWVMADATYDVIPHGAEGVPLSLLETRRRLLTRRPVTWRPVVGEAVDDAMLDEPTRRNLESMLRAGGFFIKDGALALGQLGDLDRLWDLLRGRPRVIQLALSGQPALDRLERRTWAWLAFWNAGALLTVTVCMVVLRTRRGDA